ncbi:hypothetical protein BOTBODRAFT_29011 [Botryobasidium botryosum FD-172 SS1]|uniref:Uncharacterized protein n=1 Tax=Botryobasidium botryosum (strain FD-172 SS1) TaxID=930990 RepID=A0A067MVA2_BOTB1|nr:hypothetical protein BOTBODRAFT_29011 [Botryobasidium botryosum FD-172 SS1]
MTGNDSLGTRGDGGRSINSAEDEQDVVSPTWAFLFSHSIHKNGYLCFPLRKNCCLRTQ